VLPMRVRAAAARSSSQPQPPPRRPVSPAGRAPAAAPTAADPLSACVLLCPLRRAVLRARLSSSSFFFFFFCKQSPCIIDRTADLNVAAHRYTWGAFMNRS
jgi:hypothetical protein